MQSMANGRDKNIVKNNNTISNYESADKDPSTNLYDIEQPDIT